MIQEPRIRVKYNGKEFVNVSRGWEHHPAAPWVGVLLPGLPAWADLLWQKLLWGCFLPQIWNTGKKEFGTQKCEITSFPYLYPFSL